MKLVLATLILVAIVQTPTAVPQEQAKKASIEGIVTRADNGQPIAGAQVMISRLNVVTAPGAGGVSGGAGGVLVGGGIISSLTVAPPLPQNALPTGAAGGNLNGPPAQIAPVTTDGEGKFVFNDLDAGTYRMNATANGFVRQEYGQRSIASGPASSAPFVLTAGQALKNAAFHLIATGTVSGRILDDAGQPAVGVPVVVLQYLYDAAGLKTLRQTMTGNANDRGEYRIYGLTPGRYYIAMGNGPGPLQGGRGGGQPSNVSYVFSYYPGVTDPGQATLVEIKAGGEVNVDMKALRQQLRAVRGRVVDSTGQMVSAAGVAPNQSPVNVSLAYTLFNGGGSFSSGRAYDPATGKFEILNVIPGVYSVQAQMQDTAGGGGITSAAMAQERQTAQAARPIAETPIVVGNADVENVLLTFVTPVTVPGKLAVEGRQLSDLPGFDRIRMNFRRTINGVPNAVGNPPQPQPTTADGTFQVVGMRTGEYFVTVVGVPADYYVKSLQFDDKDFLGKTLEFSGSAGTGFNILLSPKSGQVSGVVTDAKLHPVPGVQAVIIPDGKRNRADLYKNGITDKDGRFTITGITPGDYKVFAWDGLEPYRYFDPDFLKTYEEKGQLVHIGESARVSADIQAIAIPQE